jgi:hypothetical protein
MAEERKTMRKTEYARDMERKYGKAWRFVNRSLTSYRNMVSFYSPTPNQCLFRLMDHLERVSALGESVLTDKQRARAKEAIWGLVARAQGYDALKECPDRREEIPYGDAESVSKAQGWAEAGLEGRRRLSGSHEDPALRHARTETRDERVHYSDPAVHLANYRIRASEGLQTILSPRHLEQFALNEKSKIMDRLERIDAHLSRTRARRIQPETCPA